MINRGATIRAIERRRNPRVSIDDRDDDWLVNAARSGDRAAMDTLLRRHYDRVHAICRRITGSSSDADDATQEVLIKLVRSLDHFDGRSRFTTWVYRVATNTALDELRRRGRRPALQIVESAEAVDHTDEAGSIDGRIVLEAALAQLPDDQRAAVVLRDVTGLDYQEIADVLAIPVGTAKSRVARGRLRLNEVYRSGQDLDPPGNQSGPNERPKDLQD